MAQITLNVGSNANDGTGQTLRSAMQDVIPGLLLNLREHYPDLHTSLEELSNRSQVRALREERLDLG